MGEALAVGFWNVLVFLTNFLVKTIVVAGAAVLVRNLGWSAAGIAAVIVVGVLVMRLRAWRAS